MGGKTDVVKGRIEEAAGALIGNDKLREKGKTDQAVGQAKQAAEKGVDQASTPRGRSWTRPRPPPARRRRSQGGRPEGRQPGQGNHLTNARRIASRDPDRPGGNSRTEPGPFSEEDLTMLQLAVVLLVIALIAALFGFGGLAGSFVGLAKIAFFVFLVLAVLSFLGGGVFRRRYFWER